MFNRKIIYIRPTLPRGFGKKHKPRKKHDFGAILEAAFILLLIVIFLWCVFGIKANAAAVPAEEFGGGLRPAASLVRCESYFDDDSRAATLFYSINRIRTENGVQPLKFSYELSDFAKARSREIVTLWTHERPDGSRVSCENLARYFQNEENAPEAVAEAWANHSGHRETLLNSSYHEIGIASYVDEFGRDYYAAEFR